MADGNADFAPTPASLEIRVLMRVGRRAAAQEPERLDGGDLVPLSGWYQDRIPGAVSSSEASTERLRAAGIRVFDANEVGELAVYIDGADEIDGAGHMIKGGGAALTREKIVAAQSRRFVCIADESKLVTTLGRYPLPVEVIPMAAEQVMRRLRGIGGEPALRAGVITDNGGHIVDVRGLAITDPLALETEINQWPGVVTVGIFARHRASACLLGTAQGVRTLDF